MSRRLSSKPGPKPAPKPMHWQTWLLTDTPWSRPQARLGQAYRSAHAFLQNDLAVIGGAGAPSLPGVESLRHASARSRSHGSARLFMGQAYSSF